MGFANRSSARIRSKITGKYWSILYRVGQNSLAFVYHQKNASSGENMTSAIEPALTVRDLALLLNVDEKTVELHPIVSH